MTAFWENWRSRAAAARGVVFDYGGVIARAPGADWRLYDSAEACGLPRARLAEGFARWRRAYDVGEMTDAEMFARIFAEAGVAVSDAQIAALVDEEQRGWQNLVPGTLDFMRQLKADGKRLGVLTNMHEEFYRNRYAENAAAYRALLDAEVVSGIERIGKPDRTIYDVAASRMGLPPESLLFLDDNAANVEGARAAGWQSELFRLED